MKNNKEPKDIKEKLISLLNLKNIREPLNLQSNESNFNFNNNSKKENLIISKPVEIFSEWPKEEILKVKK